jgi:DNA-binding NtrC family response regulator
MSKTVLIVSYDPELLSPHMQALIDAGYEVRACASFSTALGAVGPGKTDLMVLSPDIPAGDRRRLEGEAKRRNQNIKIVLFCEGERVKDVFASATLLMSETPAALIAMAGQLLSQ